jgi:hypothetical protein
MFSYVDLPNYPKAKSARGMLRNHIDTYYYIDRKYPLFSNNCQKIDINVTFITFKLQAVNSLYYLMV